MWILLGFTALLALGAVFVVIASVDDSDDF